MIRIDVSDGFIDPVVPRLKSVMLWVARLVHGIVSSNPGVVLVMLSELLPEPDRAVLEVFVVPELSLKRRCSALALRL